MSTDRPTVLSRATGTATVGSMTRRYLACLAFLVLVTGPLMGATLALMLAVAAPAPAQADTGPWTWPLSPEPRVVRDFDPPEQRWLAGHRGVDLAGAAGAPVLAAGGGRVTYAGWLVDRGVVVVTHGELRTTYEPVDPAVSVGAVVRPGDALGTLAVEGAHCAPATCLHWGLRRGDTYLNPLLLVRRGPARLLPVWTASAVSSPVADGTRPASHADEAGGDDGPDAAPARAGLDPLAAGAALVAGAATGAALWTSRSVPGGPPAHDLSADTPRR